MKHNTVILVFLMFLFVGCTEKSPTSKAQISSDAQLARYLVKETFNVGRNVVVRSLSLDKSSHILWVGTSVGVLKVDTTTGNVLETITRENGLANEYVFASYVDTEGGAWFGTNGGGVSYRAESNWKTFFPMHGLADYWVYSFTESPGEAMWIGTWAGLTHYDYKTGKFKTYLKELVNEWVYGLDVDSKGHLWVGTEGGINKFDGQNWSVWTNNDGLGAPNKTNLTFSTNTGLGTRSRHDLSVLAQGSETYNPNYVFCVQVDKKDQVWAGTWGGGASYFNGEKWSNLTTEDGLAGNIVYSLDVKGDLLWFGTDKGLSYYNGRHWGAINVGDGLLDSHVYAVVVDVRGRVWAGTRNGVALIEKAPL